MNKESDLVRIARIKRHQPERLIQIDTNFPHALPEHKPGEEWIRYGSVQSIIKPEPHNGHGTIETVISEIPVVNQKPE